MHEVSIPVYKLLLEENIKFTLSLLYKLHLRHLNVVENFTIDTFI